MSTLRLFGCIVLLYGSSVFAQDDADTDDQADVSVESVISPSSSDSTQALSAPLEVSNADINTGKDAHNPDVIENDSPSADRRDAPQDTYIEKTDRRNNGASEENEKAGYQFRFIKKLTKKSERGVKGRVFGYYKMTDKSGVPNRFKLDVARLNLSWRQGRALEAVLEYDFAGLVKKDADGLEIRDGLKDAYVRIEPFRWFGVQLGSFKRPFSRLELTSRKKLATISRGEANDYALGFLEYGGRDIGAMISGRLIKKIKLDYAASVFNGGGAENLYLGNNSLDYVFRLESSPVKWLKVGASFSTRVIDKEDFEEFFQASDYAGLVDPDFPIWLVPEEQEFSLAVFTREYAWLAGTHKMGEFDVKLDFGGFEAVVETMLGQNWWFQESPYLLSVSSLLSYRFPLFDGAMAIEPVLFAEMLHIEDSDWTWRVRMMQLNPGVNVHFGDHVRLMIHGQLTRTQGVEADIDEAPLRGFWPGEWPGNFVDSNTLYIQVGFAN